MRILRHNGFKYYLSESARDDELARAMFGMDVKCWEIKVNLSTAKVLVPSLPWCCFESTIGDEQKPLDDWSEFEIGLCRALRRFPQHFAVVSGACLRRETMVPTCQVAVYQKEAVDGCTCKCCEKGLLWLVAEAVEQDIKRPEIG